VTRSEEMDLARMEIQALRLLRTEQDLYQFAVQGAGAHQVVRDLRLQIAPEGVHVAGTYPTSLMDIPFATLWHLSVRCGQLLARLGRIQTGNGDSALDVFTLIGPGAVRATLMTAIGRALRGEEGLRVEGETVLVDPDRLAARRGWPVRTNLVAVHCGQGALVVESSLGPGPTAGSAP
jgi:hypothetical protein